MGEVREGVCAIEDGGNVKSMGTRVPWFIPRTSPSPFLMEFRLHPVHPPFTWPCPSRRRLPSPVIGLGSSPWCSCGHGGVRGVWQGLLGEASSLSEGDTQEWKVIFSSSGCYCVCVPRCTGDHRLATRKGVGLRAKPRLKVVEQEDGENPPHP